MPDEHLTSASHSFAERLIDESPDALVALSLDGRIRSWNRGAAAMFGYGSHEALGQFMNELVVPPDRRGAAEQCLDDVLRTGAALTGSVRRRKDGTLIHVDVSMHRVEDPDAPPFIAVRERHVDDATAPPDVQASDATFSGLLEAAPVAIVIVNRTGHIVIVNAQTESLFGYRRHELLGAHADMLLPERLRGRRTARRAGFFATPRKRSINTGLELWGLKKNGTEFPIEITLSARRTGGELLVSSAIRDITVRKQLEREIIETSRLKSEFLANMSHELRTPLNAIIGFAELMHKGKVGPVAAEHREYLGDILTSSRHLLQLINDVLDLAKVESGNMDIRPEPVDIRTLTTEVRDVLRGLAAGRQLRIETEVAAEVTLLTVDPARVKQVLYNYLSNAIKFTQEGGVIQVRVLPEGPAHFRIDVADTGVGIAESELEHLFVEFRQLDASAAKRYQGTGLGLALTKRIAEAHGGHVAVRSVEGAGSTFSVILPRDTAPSR